MPAFDSLQRASFASIEFPIEEVTIDGGLRDHVHEYPHADGGAPEKLGRKLYVVHMKALFHATFRSYPGLWPGSLQRLRQFFELGATDDLAIPTIGTISAYAFEWKESQTARRRSGVSVDLTFREDQETAFLTNALVAVESNAISAAVEQLVLVRDSFENTPTGQVLLVQDSPDTAVQRITPPTDDEMEVLGLIDGITESVNDILALGDQIDLAANVVSAKVERVTSLCAQLDRKPTLGDPRNEPIREALHDVWGAAEARRRDLAKRREQIMLYVTQRIMSVTDVSVAIYGDASRTTQILQLNAIENPWRIPKGTALRAYRPESIAA